MTGPELEWAPVAWEALHPQTAQALRALAVAAPTAALAGDIVALHWFAGRFGPDLEVPTVLALVHRDSDVALVAEVISGLYPTRWRVTSTPASGPLTIDRVELAIDAHGSPVFRGDASGLADLHDGVLRPVAGSPETAVRQAFRRWLERYPVLSAPDLKRDGGRLPPADEVHADIKRREVGGRRRARLVSPAESPWLDLVLRWHDQADRQVRRVPTPPPAPLPLEDPWEAGDSSFREWVIDQTGDGVPRSTRDEFLAQALAAQRVAGQKPTHQGVQIAQHAIRALLCLDTSRIAPADRRAMRVAVLFHDYGKLHNVWTPGAHAKIGAALWAEHRPAWLTRQESDLVSFLIENHDALGWLDRGLRDPDYRGGLCGADVRETMAGSGRGFNDSLALISTIYRADIASVPTLRWLLPLTPLLEGLVRAGAPAEPPPIVIILGPPGGGKSTHALSLATTLGPRALVLSVPALIRRTPDVWELLTDDQRRDVDLLVEDAWRRAGRGQLGPRRYDEIVCELLARITDRPLVLDAFPRSREVAEMFVSVEGTARRSAAIVLTLDGGDGVESSIRRQLIRQARRVGEVAAQEQLSVFRRRAEFYRDESRRAAEVLAAAGIPVVEVATTAEFPVAQREMRSFLASVGAPG